MAHRAAESERASGLGAFRMAAAAVALALAAACEARPASVAPGGSEHDRCATDEVPVGGGCIPAECGAAPWGANGDADVFVDGTAAPGGDGSARHPLASIQSGADAATAGGTVAIAAGTYAEILALTVDHDGVTLAGRCAQMVTLDGTVGGLESIALSVIGEEDRRPVVTLHGMAVNGGGHQGIHATLATIRGSNLTMDGSHGASIVATGPDAMIELSRAAITSTLPEARDAYLGQHGVGVVAVEGARISMTDVAVAGSHTYGILVGNADSALECVRCSITTTLADTSAGFGGTGVQAYDYGSAALTDTHITRNAKGGAFAHDHGSVTLTRTEVTDNGYIGVAVRAGGSATLNETSIRRTEFRDRVGGWGVYADIGGIVTGNGGEISDSAGAGVLTHDVGTILTFTDVRLARNLEHGVHAYDGASVSLIGGFVVGNAGTGVLAFDGAHVHMNGTAVLDTVANGSNSGWGVFVEGATASLTSVTLANNTAVGLVAHDEGTVVTVQDVMIVGTLQGPDEGAGQGVQVYGGARLTGSGLSLVGNQYVALDVHGHGFASLTDVQILGTFPGTNGTYGRGIELQSSGELYVERCVVSGSADSGVNVRDASVLDLVDCVVSGNGNRGIEIASAVFHASRLSVLNNVGIGLIASGERAEVHIDDCEVSDTRKQIDDTNGRGVEIERGAQATLTNCVLSGNRETGVFASDGAKVSLADVVISNTLKTGRYIFAEGVLVQGGADVEALRLTVTGTGGPGLYVTDATMACVECVLTGNAFAGALVVYGPLTIADSYLADNGPDSDLGGGMGVFATGQFGGSSLEVRNTTIDAHRYAAVWIDGPGRYDIEDNRLQGGEPFSLNTGPMHGNAVFGWNGITAWDGETGLLLARNTIFGAGGNAVLLHDSTATLSENAWSDNTVDLRQQSCLATTRISDAEVADIPTVGLCSGSSTLIDTYMEYVGLQQTTAPPND